MKTMKKACSMFLALVMALGLAITASAEGPAASKYISFDQDPVGIYELPVQSSRWDESANAMQTVDELWTLYVFPDGTEFTFSNMPDGYTGWGAGWDGYEDGGFTIGGGMIETEFMGNTFILEEDEMVWELGLDYFDEAADKVVSTVEIRITSASKAALLPLQPVGSGPAELPSKWAQGYVKTAVEAGIVPANLQSNYTQAATRGEFCALAVQLYETATGKTVEARVKFNDTADVNVEKAAALGVISGVAVGQAAPNGTITREQAAVMLARLAEACGKPLSTGQSNFADGGSISGWAVEAVNQVASNGIMSGTGDNQFSSQSQYTREQSITTMLSLFSYIKK